MSRGAVGSAGADRERRALELVDAALELASDERAAFVERACADDPSLAREVHELLEREATAGELPPLDVDRELFAAHPPVGAIDGYELVRLLGEGGMGRVYEAWQQRPRRRVAIKVLRTGLDTPRARRRFQFEAEALARLHHPAIAQVYAVGSFRIADLLGDVDAPYFAMEFVHGAKDIVAYARARVPGTADRIRLMQTACAAVHHAHQRGVLHRDLKASNVLVDDAGQVKVIDFGIARALESEGAWTSSGATVGGVLGTPAAVAPELLSDASAVPDVRADVYALGVLAFELICGVPPFDVRGLPVHEAVTELLMSAPPRPTRCNADVSPDLEAVLLKAMARDPRVRYADAAAFADDLENALHHRPVSARRPSRARGVFLFLRRHRAASAAAAAVVLAVLAGGALSLHFGLRAVAAGERHRLAAEAALDSERAALAARDEADRARGAVLELATAFVFDFATKLSRVPGATDARADILARGLDALDAWEDAAGSAPAHALALARATVRLGDVLGHPEIVSLGRVEEARAAYERAAERLERARAGGAPPADVDAVAALLEQRRGQMAFHDGDEAAAAHHLDASLELLRRAAAGAPHDGGAGRQLANALISRGQAAGVAGETARARELFEEAHAIRRRAWEANPADAAAALDHAGSLALLGAAALRSDDAERAVELYLEAAAHFDDAHQAHPDDLHAGLSAAQVRIPLTEALWPAGRLDEALAVADRGIELAEELARTDAAHVDAERLLGNLWFDRYQTLRLRSARATSPEERADDLAAAHAALLRSRASFEGLRDSGRLLGREAGHLARIEAELAELEASGGDS